MFCLVLESVMVLGLSASMLSSLVRLFLSFNFIMVSNSLYIGLF